MDKDKNYAIQKTYLTPEIVKYEIQVLAEIANDAFDKSLVKLIEAAHPDPAHPPVKKIISLFTSLNKVISKFGEIHKTNEILL